MFGTSKNNPMNWPQQKLSELADVGSSKRVFVSELKEEGIPFYRGTEVGALAVGETIVPELFITKEHYEALKAATGVAKPGDLLMPSICPDGRIWQVDTETPFYFKDGRVLWVHIRNYKLNSTYLLHLLKEIIRSDYGRIASGTTFVELKIFALKDLSIMLPDLFLQERYETLVQRADKSKFCIRFAEKILNVAIKVTIYTGNMLQ